MTSNRLRLILMIASGGFLLYLAVGFFAVPALIKHQLVKHVEQDLKHKLSAGDVRFNPLTFALELNDLDLREPNDRPLLSLKRLLVNFEASSTFRRAWNFAEISLEAPVLNGELRKDGSTNFTALIEALRNARRERAGAPPPVTIDVIRLSDGRVDLADLQAGENARVRLAPIAFELTHLSTLPAEKGPYKLTARSSDGETLTWDGDVSLNPISSHGKLTLSGWKVATLVRMLGSRTAVESAEGKLDASLDYVSAYAEGKASASVKDFDLNVAQLSIVPKNGSGPLLTAERIALGDVTFDWSQRAVAARRLEVSSGTLALDIGADAQPNWIALIATRAQAHAAEKTKDASEAAQPDGPKPQSAADQPWKIALDAIKVSDFGLRYSDRRAAVGASASAKLATLAGAVAAELAPAGSTITATALDANVETFELVQGTERLAAGPVTVSVAAAKAAAGTSAIEWALESLAVKVDKPSARRADEEFGSQQVSIGVAAVRSTPATGSVGQRIVFDAIAIESSDIGARFANAKADSIALKSIALGAKSFSLDVGADAFDVNADALSANLTGLKVREPGSGAEVARLERAEASGGSFSLGESRVDFERLLLSGGHASASVDSAGKLDWDALVAAFAARPQDAARPITRLVTAKRWRASVKNAELRDFSGTLTDQRQAPPLTIALTNVQSRARDLSTDRAKATRVNLSGRIGDAGQFSADGRVNAHTLETDLKVKLAGLPLLPLQPFLAQHVRAKIESGLASAEGRLRYGQRERTGAEAMFEGTLGLDKVVIDETEPAQSFLSFAALKASDAKLTWAPNRLDVAELRVDTMSAKLLIAEDQSVNIPKLMRARPGAAKPVQAAPAAALAQPIADAFPISVARTRIDNSRLDFADLSLRPQFAASMHELKGVITRISTAPDTTAQLELDARVDEFGLARIRGEINPFAPRVYTDVDMQFRNLAMSPLSPYSAKFAGYNIASGTMSMDLQYKIKNGMLLGENKLVLDKLELGERVESPTALNLPLELAIAILKDSDGRIDLGIPVTGSLDDPQFSYGALIWKAIGTVLARIVTAPFRALASLFGGSSEKLDAIEFDAGSDRLLPPERQKLRTVAAALDKRPQLKLTVKPTYAASVDRSALQEAAIRREVALRSGFKLQAGDEPGPIDYGNPRPQQAIAALFRERNPTAATTDLRARLANAFATAIEAVKQDDKTAAIAREQNARTMVEQLIQSHPVSDDELAGLAKRRGAAIVQELGTAGKLDPSRMQTAGPAATSGNDKTIPTALDLSVAQ